MINYGTNNPKAWSVICEVTQRKHRWECHRYNRCISEYICKDCGASTEVDSSD